MDVDQYYSTWQILVFVVSATMSDWEEESQPPLGYNPDAAVETVIGKVMCACLRARTCVCVCLFFV